MAGVRVCVGVCRRGSVGFLGVAVQGRGCIEGGPQSVDHALVAPYRLSLCRCLTLCLEVFGVEVGLLADGDDCPGGCGYCWFSAHRARGLRP